MTVARGARPAGPAPRSGRRRGTGSIPTSDEIELNGVRVVVTGATTGLGAAMAAALAEAGARVMVTGRDQARAEAAASELGSSALPCQLDVRDERSVAACVARACDAWGGVDMLVNNAGIGMRTVNPRFMTEPQPFWEVTPAGFRDVVETKLVGCFLMAREVVPLMLSEGGGRIVNISMNEQTMVRRGFVPYGPAGAGVEAMSRVMAADLAGSSVTVNILLPGGRGTLTGMVPDETPAEVRARLLDPAVMGPPIVWLASDQAAGVHDRRIVANEFDVASANAMTAGDERG
jgi:NAD(P)-dependent dehydrogenase (short-subunit alcohol dehydrogenase family)